MIPVCLYVKKVLEEDKKLVVVAFHKKMLDALEDICKINDFEYIKFDGKFFSFFFFCFKTKIKHLFL